MALVDPERTVKAINVIASYMPDPRLRVAIQVMLNTDTEAANAADLLAGRLSRLAVAAHPLPETR
jgi:hypothetical protein